MRSLHCMIQGILLRQCTVEKDCEWRFHKRSLVAFFPAVHIVTPRRKNLDREIILLDYITLEIYKYIDTLAHNSYEEHY